ncbi:hypothetical protein [Gulbenkiania mobilis]|nr:hypothetical protein [Gulbenkiania mobilis]
MADFLIPANLHPASLDQRPELILGEPTSLSNGLGFFPVKRLYFHRS